LIACSRLGTHRRNNRDIAERNRKRALRVVGLNFLARRIQNREIAEELRGEAATRINQKKSEYEVAQHALTEVGKERQAAALRLAERYEPMLGKEFMTAEKIAALKDIMENGTVTNLAEAIARYRDRQES